MVAPFVAPHHLKLLAAVASLLSAAARVAASGLAVRTAALRDDDLLHRLRSGDEDAFAQLVRTCGGPLLSAARRLLRCEEEARDALQDSFLSAIQAIDSFQGQSQLTTWLHRIVVNTCLMRLRSRRRHPEEPIEDLLPGFDDTGHALGPSVPWFAAEHEIVRRETCALVRAAIDRLPDPYRTVLLLRDIEELDTAETSALLGISENAVKIRLHRARQALRALLDPDLRRVAS